MHSEWIRLIASHSTDIRLARFARSPADTDEEFRVERVVDSQLPTADVKIAADAILHIARSRRWASVNRAISKLHRARRSEARQNF